MITLRDANGIERRGALNTYDPTPHGGTVVVIQREATYYSQPLDMPLPIFEAIYKVAGKHLNIIDEDALKAQFPEAVDAAMKRLPEEIQAKVIRENEARQADRSRRDGTSTWIKEPATSRLAAITRTPPSSRLLAIEAASASLKPDDAEVEFRKRQGVLFLEDGSVSPAAVVKVAEALPVQVTVVDNTQEFAVAAAAPAVSVATATSVNRTGRLTDLSPRLKEFMARSEQARLEAEFVGPPAPPQSEAPVLQRTTIAQAVHDAMQPRAEQPPVMHTPAVAAIMKRVASPEQIETGPEALLAVPTYAQLTDEPAPPDAVRH
jgi:hypothetical protein